MDMSSPENMSDTTKISDDKAQDEPERPKEPKNMFQPEELLFAEDKVRPIGHEDSRRIITLQNHNLTLKSRIENWPKDQRLQVERITFLTIDLCTVNEFFTEYAWAYVMNMPDIDPDEPEPKKVGTWWAFFSSQFHAVSEVLNTQILNEVFCKIQLSTEFCLKDGEDKDIHDKFDDLLYEAQSRSKSVAECGDRQNWDSEWEKQVPSEDELQMTFGERWTICKVLELVIELLDILEHIYVRLRTYCLEHERVPAKADK